MTTRVPKAEFKFVDEQTSEDGDNVVITYNVSGELADILQKKFGLTGRVIIKENSDREWIGDCTFDWYKSAALYIGKTKVLGGYGELNTSEYGHEPMSYTMPSLVNELTLIGREELAKESIEDNTFYLVYRQTSESRRDNYTPYKMESAGLYKSEFDAERRVAELTPTLDDWQIEKLTIGDNEDLQPYS